MATKYEISRKVELELIPKLLNGMGGLGPTVSEMFSSGHHKEIAELKINPLDYSDSWRFQRDYAAVNLLRKYPGLRTGINTRDVAMGKFEETEERCASLNFRLARPYLLSKSTQDILWMARKECEKVLGKFSWDATEPFLAFGPGASIGIPRRKSHPYYKIGTKTPTATGEALTVDTAFINSVPLWKKFRETNGIDPKVVAGSKIVTVPKDARSDRVIAIEPQLNMFFQKGIGGLMRSRLKKAGCDLNNQSVNQRLAFVGSRDESLATIDLSSASDSISRELVEILIPEDWLVALKSVRCVYTSLTSSGDGVSHPHFLSKFSSMGNGYTFELESLLFMTLAKACCRYYGTKDRVVSVYGDDIVISTGVAQQYIDLLAEVGFTTNVEKSYIVGAFRESCGKHFFSGRDVTPFYLKKEVNDRESLLWLLNSIRRLAYRFVGIGWGCDEALLPSWLYCRQLVADRYKLHPIPEGFGDGGVVLDFDEVCPTPNRQKSWVEGYTTKHLVRKYTSHQKAGEGLLVLSLHDLEKRLGRSLSEEKGDVSRVNSPRYRLSEKTLKVTQWPSLGPWVQIS